MEEFNALPIFRQGINEITDGFEINVPDFCKKSHCNEKCINYYKEIYERGVGIYTCPYGFCSCAFKVSDELVIFTSLRIDDQNSQEKNLPEEKTETTEDRVINAKALDIYIEAYKQFYENEKRFNDFEQFVNNIFHDIRKFNMQIKAKNDIIHRKAEKNKKYSEFIEASRSIQATCWFLTIRLESYDFTYNQQLMQTDIKTSYNIFKILDKIRKCMKEKAGNKFVHIYLEAKRQCQDMQAYDCIELLPFILLDNAIKYAPDGTDIEVTVEEKTGRQHVQIKSLGPMLKYGEDKLIFDRGYRSTGARAVTNDGLGIGLYTAKQICLLHNIEIKVKSSDIAQRKIGDTEYSEFSVDFWIPL